MIEFTMVVQLSEGMNRISLTEDFNTQLRLTAAVSPEMMRDDAPQTWMLMLEEFASQIKDAYLAAIKDGAVEYEIGPSGPRRWPDDAKGAGD